VVFPNWLLLLGIMFSRVSMLEHVTVLHSFPWLYCMDIPHFVRMFWWAVVLFPPIDSCDWCCCKHWYILFVLAPIFSSFCYLRRSGIIAE
jgi:hypothetical protein